MNDNIIKIDCHACKLEDVMVKTNIPKFSGFIRSIGFLLAAPSFIGMVFSVFMIFSFRGEANNPFKYIPSIRDVFRFGSFGIAWVVISQKKEGLCVHQVRIHD